jgi:hypothetical protein
VLRWVWLQQVTELRESEDIVLDLVKSGVVGFDLALFLNLSLEGGSERHSHRGGHGIPGDVRGT